MSNKRALIRGWTWTTNEWKENFNPEAERMTSSKRALIRGWMWTTNQLLFYEARIMPISARININDVTHSSSWLKFEGGAHDIMHPKRLTRRLNENKQISAIYTTSYISLGLSSLSSIKNWSDNDLARKFIVKYLVPASLIFFLFSEIKNNSYL